MTHVKRNEPHLMYVHQRDLTMSLQNLFYPAVSVGDTQASFGQPIKLETNTMRDLLAAVKASENLSELPDRADIEVLMHADGRGSKQLVRYNKVLVGMMLHPLDEHIDNFIDTTGTMREDAAAFAKNLCEEIPQPPLNAEEWIDRLKYAANDNPEILVLIDSLPPCMRDLEQVGKTHVIVPDSYNMTEDMIDASRSLLLYTDTFGTHRSSEIRDQIALRPWVRDNLPQWFKDQNDHLTKAGRADLAYHLTLQAYLNPPVAAQKHFAATENATRAFRTKDFDYGLELVLKTADGELLIQRAFGTFWTPARDGDSFDFRLNRHELPDAWRGYFKKQAIEVSGLIQVAADGTVMLASERVRLSLKNDHVATVGWEYKGSVKIPKKPVRNIE